MSRTFLTVFYFFLLYPVEAQQFLTFTGALKDKQVYNVISELQVDYMKELYTRGVELADEQINGREYIPYYFKCKIKPLLFDEKERTGSLIFNGRRYNNLQLEYDTYLDQLIYYDSSKFINNKLFKIALNKDPVDGFSLYFGSDSMIFRHFGIDDGRKLNLSEGFYEIVYEGKSKLIIRHLSLPVEDEGVYEYRYTPSEYVMIGERFSRVRSTGSFIKLFGKDSDTIRKFMRTNKIHFRRAEKGELAAVLRYYDTLAMINK